MGDELLDFVAWVFFSFMIAMMRFEEFVVLGVFYDDGGSR